MASLEPTLRQLFVKVQPPVHDSTKVTTNPEDHRLSSSKIWFSMLTLCIAVTAAKTAKGFHIIAAIASWTMASVLMNLFNKQAATEFPATCLLIIMQMLITNVTIIAMRHQELHWPVWRDFRRWLPVPCIVAAMLGTSIFALKGTTVSTVLILRNVLPIITFGLEKSIYNNPPEVTSGHWGSMLATLFGTVLYGIWNISVTCDSAMIVLAGCVITVIDKLLQRHLLQSSDFTQSLAVCMLMNNVIGIFPLVLFAIAKGEVQHWQTVVLSTSKDCWAIVVATGLAGCCLGYFGLEVAKHIPAASVLMLQNASKVIIIGIGVAVFGDDITGVSALGCIISMLGSAWYGYEAIKTSRPAKAKQAEPQDEPSVVNKDVSSKN